MNITEIGSQVANEKGGQLDFNDFSSILEQLDSSENVPFEGPDPKVVEFLRILEGKKKICVRSTAELIKIYINTNATTVLYCCLSILRSTASRLSDEFHFTHYGIWLSWSAKV